MCNDMQKIVNSKKHIKETNHRLTEISFHVKNVNWMLRRVEMQCGAPVFYCDQKFHTKFYSFGKSCVFIYEEGGFSVCDKFDWSKGKVITKL